jgi:hypothetical protein
VDLSSEDSPAEYCRRIENYLCRKNDGHLIRIVGPAFEQVTGWADRGVPLKVAFHGIDRYFERYYKKGPRRRPIRIEFCEADVLDVFDEWRRAVGVPATTGASDGESEEGTAPRHGSLPSHLDRVIARLTSLRGGPDRALDELLDTSVTELDAARVRAKTLRGEARRVFLDRLAAIDRSLLDAAREQCDAATLDDLNAEAEAELTSFRSRMPAEAFEQARRACVDRLIRDRARLPIVRFE